GRSEQEGGADRVDEALHAVKLLRPDRPVAIVRRMHCALASDVPRWAIVRAVSEASSTRLLHARGAPPTMLTRRQDELFSHAARLALRGAHAAKDGDKPSSLKPLLEGWSEIEALLTIAPMPARRVANKILLSAETRKPLVSNGRADHDSLRAFGQ